MDFKEPKVEFVKISKDMVIKASTSCEASGAEYTCDDQLFADLEICNCYNSPSEAVSQISE